MRFNLPTALTFDDGPTPKVTLRLLEVLAARGVLATFFCIGSHAMRDRAIVSEIARRGHDIGNHSWSHPSFSALTDEEILCELRKTHDCLCDASGKVPTFLRPPYGIISQGQRELARQWFGYSTIMWNVDTNDWRRPGVNAISSAIVGSLGKGSVVLLHDTSLDTVNSIADVLSKIERPESQFTTISELRRINAAVQNSGDELK